MTLPGSRTGRAWWAVGAEDVASDLDTDLENGLDRAAARNRLDAAGPNELEEEPPTPLWMVFLRQFANTMIIVLLVAAGITVAIGDAQDAIVIMAIVVMNGIIGFVQEYRAEKAMDALRSMSAPSARVVRAGAQATIPARELVPGDVLLLETGDVVPADARLAECPNLRVDESALTGESVPVDKIRGPIDEDDGDLVAERSNMVFKGTSVVYGRARAVVVATGMETALGEIAGLLKKHQAPQTPLQRRLAGLGRGLAAAALVASAVVFAVGVARGEDVTEMFLTAVSLAVAAIPEALPAVVTIGLALGARRMVAQNALIRKLPAVEALGSVTVICTDKTGTLTEGRMVVERIRTADGEYEVTGSGYEPAGDIRRDGEPVTPEPDGPVALLLRVSALCNDAKLVAPSSVGEAWTVAGDPTEGAMLALAGKTGRESDDLDADFPRVHEVPFDSERKRMSTIHRRREGSGGFVAAKGAAEAIVEACTTVAAGSGNRELTPGGRDEILHAAEAFAAGGYRVLAAAGKDLASVDGGAEDENYEHGLTFYGLVAMADPPRPESPDAVEACRRAGIIPIMITGDHPATGRAIADRLGMIGGADVLTGAELREQGPDRLTERVDEVAVYARTSPEQKLDIVQAWKGRGDIVAMTGDGVNDAPALRTADIGVTMGVAGTDVAKEAADMVLTDDNFATIVAAVSQGRRIYDNIRRFVRYTLTSNTGEIWVMLLGPFVGLSVPLGPAQILWINLVTDGLPGLALSIEGPEKDVMERPPRRPEESMFARGLWQHVLVVGLLMGLIPLGLGMWGEATDRPWQTMVFTSLALLQLGNALAVRSEKESFWSLGAASNPAMLWAVLGTVALQLGVVYWGPVQRLLDTEALDAFELAVVLVASTGIFWVVEAEKAWRRRRASRRRAA